MVYLVFSQKDRECQLEGIFNTELKANDFRKTKQDYAIDHYLQINYFVKEAKLDSSFRL